MRIRITKKVDEDNKTFYSAYRRTWAGWVFVTLRMDCGVKDPISELRKRVEARLKKEVTVLEYDL